MPASFIFSPGPFYHFFISILFMLTLYLLFGWLDFYKLVFFLIETLFLVPKETPLCRKKEFCFDFMVLALYYIAINGLLQNETPRKVFKL